MNLVSSLKNNIQVFSKKPMLFFYKVICYLVLRKILKIQKDCIIKISNRTFTVPNDIIPFLVLEEVFVYEEYKNLRDMDCILDLGGFLGESTLYFILNNNKKVVVFEPDPDNFKYLAKNLSKYKNVEFYNYAVVNSNDDYLIFYKSKKFDYGANLYNLYKNEKIQRIKVKTIHISEVMRKYKFDGIKMDIEGGEFEIFDYFLNNREDFNFYKGYVEIHFKGKNEKNMDILKKFLKFLESNGYVYFFIKNNKKFNWNEILNNYNNLSESQELIFLLYFEKMNLKIQFLINSLTSGGAEKVATIVSNKLSELNKYKIMFYTLEKDKFYNLNKKIKYKILSNFTLKTNKLLKLLFLPILTFRYLKETKRNNPTLLISFLEISNFISILVGKLTKKKVIISVRANPLLMYPKNSFYGLFHRILIKLLYPKADKIIAVSKEIELILNKKFKIPKEKIKTIYNPHYIEEYQRLANEPLEEKYERIFKDSFVFINIGRLTEAKGQWFLIRTFKKVVEKHPNAKLIILGEGELKEKLQELINKLELQNNVFLLGVQKNPFKSLKRGNCFVFSSLWEGLPNTLIEALSLNLPVISTDCKTGPREILAPELPLEKEIDYPYFGRYGILTKTFPRKFVFKDLKEEPLSKEEKMLADLMIKMIEDKDLRKKYSNGLERAKDFDVEKIIKEWEKIIKETIN